MKIKLMAGEMAKLHGISKQTLLYYDRIGLFKPQETIEETGYRYYNIEQCEDLDVILCLKNLGMKLSEIKKYLEQGSIKERISLLEGQETLVNEKIKEILSTKNRLGSIISSLKKRIKIKPFEMGIRHCKQKDVISEEVKPPFDLYSLEIAIKKIIASARKHYEADVHNLLIYTETPSYEEELFKKVAATVNSHSGEHIEAGDYAYIYHQGTYQALKESRQTLRNFIKKEGFKETSSTTIEKMLLDSLAVSSENDYLIEILIPVEKI